MTPRGDGRGDTSNSRSRSQLLRSPLRGADAAISSSLLSPRGAPLTAAGGSALSWQVPRKGTPARSPARDRTSCSRRVEPRPSSGRVVAGLASRTAQGTLPWSWYFVPTLLRQEQERIFRRGWQYARPRNTRRSRVTSSPATSATCPWSSPATAPASCTPCSRLPPPRLDRRRGPGQPRDAAVSLPRVEVWARRAATGRTAGARGAGARHGRDRALRKLALATWGPLLFVHPDPDASPLAETLGPLPELFRRRAPRVLPLRGRPSRLQRRGRRLAGPVPAGDARARLEAVRPHEARRPAGLWAVPLALADDEDLRAAWAAEPRRRPGRPARSGADSCLPRLLSPRTSRTPRSTSCSGSTTRSGSRTARSWSQCRKGVRSGLLDEGRLMPESERLLADFQQLVREALA
jgi:hypothetical protein